MPCVWDLQHAFELKLLANENKNDFDELDYFYPVYKVCVREDIAESIVDADVNFGYQFDNYYYGIFELNTETKELTMVERTDDGFDYGEPEEVTSSFTDYEVEDGLTIYHGSYRSELFELKDNIASIEAEIPEDVEILRVQGTLSIAE